MPPLRVLIVDDNADFLAAARRLLEHEGINVVAVASSGAEALRHNQEHKPDVILVDVDLGQENGFDVVEHLAAETESHQPVVLISAYPEQDLKDLLETSPAIGFISKSQLSANAIVEVLDGRGREEGSGSS
ncbi:MAG TPA: response regulator [Acidimicrobiales bacterium]|jgi:CheY-like chemotaxis protein|nr:response regulator [Acidimicrobiales bacterium]